MLSSGKSNKRKHEILDADDVKTRIVSFCCNRDSGILMFCASREKYVQAL